MPPRGVKSPKRKRQYKAIKKASRARGMSLGRAEELASRVVNAIRGKSGAAKKKRSATAGKTARKRTTTARKAAGRGRSTARKSTGRTTARKSTSRSRSKR